MMTTIDEIYELQKKQMMAAFYGEGPWELNPSVRAKYALTKDKWDSMNSDEKNKYFLDFCAYLPRTRPATITDREKLIEMSAKVGSTKAKDNQRKRARNERTKPKFTGTAKEQRSDFMKEFDDLVAKDIRTRFQQNSAEAPSNDAENIEASMDVHNNDILDHPTNTETSAPSNKRKKYNKNSENKYACEYCDKDYTQLHNLKKHIANCHKTKVTAV